MSFLELHSHHLCLMVSLSLYTDGAGLFAGVLNHFLSRGSQCPKVLAATHFHELFKPGLFDPRTRPVTFVHMQVILTDEAGRVLSAPGAQSAVAGGEDQDDVENEILVRPGERITYLYKSAEFSATAMLLLLMNSLCFSECAQVSPKSRMPRCAHPCSASRPASSREPHMFPICSLSAN